MSCLCDGKRCALNAAAGLPLSGCVRIQHPGALHPRPDSVHPGSDGLLFHATPAPLNAVLNPEHENRLLPSPVLACFDGSVEKDKEKCAGEQVSPSQFALPEKYNRATCQKNRCQHPGLETPCKNKQTNKQRGKIRLEVPLVCLGKKKSNVTLRNNRIKNEC